MSTINELFKEQNITLDRQMQQPTVNTDFKSLFGEYGIDPTKGEILKGRKVDDEKGLWKSLFSEPLKLGEFLGARKDTEKLIETKVKTAKMMTQLAEKIERGEVDADQRRRITKMLGQWSESPVEIPEEAQITNEQLFGDVFGTLLWLTPYNEVKGLKKIATLSRLARGSALGSSFGTAMGLSEGASKEDIWKHALTGAVFGATTEAAAPFVFKGFGKALLKTAKVTRKGVLKVIPETISKPFKSIKERLSSLGPWGEQLANKLELADANALRKTGLAMNAIEQSGFYKLSKAEGFTVLDALEGRVNSKSLSKKTSKAYNALNNVRKGIEDKAKEKGVKVRLRKGEVVDFVPRKDYVPHFSPELNQLKKGKLRREVIDNAVRTGKFKNKKDATLALNSYINVVEKDGRGETMDFWVKHMMKSGQAKSKDEAIGKTLRFFKPSKNKRFGSLERAREVDFPFYDPDIKRVFPRYILGANMRLEKIGAFGPDGKKLDLILGKLTREQKKTLGAIEGREAASEARMLIKRAMGVVEGASDKKTKVLNYIAAIQRLKLAYAQMLNLGQNVNTLLATDLPSVAKGLQMAFRSEGRQFALKSGATLEALLRESATIGADVSWDKIFLKYTGFSWTEKFNRTVSANAGANFVRRQRAKLLKNPDDQTASRLLQEFGIENPKALLTRDFSQTEILNVAQKTSFLTQFRSRPLDLPLFASSPEGKVIFQFKNFIFNQTKFVKNQLVKEFKAKDPMRMARSLLILSAVFPMTGEVIADIRSLVTGSTRPTKFLDRYLENLFNVGAVGIWGDAITAAKFEDLTNFAAGPAASTFFETMERMVNISFTGEVRDSDLKFLIRQPGITRTVANYVFPSESKERETILESIGEALE